MTSAHWAEGGRFEATEPGLKRRRANVVPGVSLRLVLLRALLCNATIQTQWRCSAIPSGRGSPEPKCHQHQDKGAKRKRTRAQNGRTEFGRWTYCSASTATQGAFHIRPTTPANQPSHKGAPQSRKSYC
jgi:hypothetical protein